MPDQDLVRYAVADGVAAVTLDSPHNRNALSAQLVRELVDGLDRVDRDQDVRMVVLTHTSGTFCAGAGGMGLVGACDMVVAGPSATFALTEARSGLAASVISAVVLPRLSGRLLGSSWQPTRSTRPRLPSSASSPGPRTIRMRSSGLTKKLRAASPQGLRESNALANHDLVEQMDSAADRVIEQSARLFDGEDAHEGMRAFLEKRPPRWAQ